jgi:SAM-dependent methyltransferase
MNSTASHKMAAASDRPENVVRRVEAPDRCDLDSAQALFSAQEREHHLLTILSSHGLLPLSGKKILEVGCGTGKWLRDLIGWGANPGDLHGVELLEASASRARRLCPAEVTIECGNAAELRMAPNTFDIILQAAVFTGVLDESMKRAMAAEMLRVLRPGGVILWYDFCFSNPQNPYVQPMGQDEIGRLFPGCSIELRRVSLASPLVRLLAARSSKMCWMLSRIPALCTHYLGALRKSPVLQ